MLLKILHKSQQVRLISYVGYQYRTDNISITRSPKGPKVWHGYLEEARSYEAMFRENYPELTGYADEKFCTRAQYGIADLRKNHTISKAEKRYWRREFLDNFKSTGRPIAIRRSSALAVQAVGLVQHCSVLRRIFMCVCGRSQLKFFTETEFTQ